MMSEKKDYILDMSKKVETKKRIWITLNIIDSFLQIIIVFGTTSVPILLIISQVPKLIPTIISGIVAVAAAVSNYYKIGGRSRIYRVTFETLEKEQNEYKYHVGPYKEDLEEDQALGLFVRRTELVLDELTKKLFALQESAQYQQNEIKKKAET